MAAVTPLPLDPSSFAGGLSVSPGTPPMTTIFASEPTPSTITVVSRLEDGIWEYTLHVQENS
jgi:hypothetical protein